MIEVTFAREYRTSALPVTGVQGTVHSPADNNTTGAQLWTFPAWRCSACRRVFIVSSEADLLHECTGDLTLTGNC